MAKANVVEEETQVITIVKEKMVNLSLTFNEACLVKAIMGSITGSSINSPRGMTDELYKVLGNALDEYTDKDAYDTVSKYIELMIDGRIYFSDYTNNTSAINL